MIIFVLFILLGMGLFYHIETDAGNEDLAGEWLEHIKIVTVMIIGVFVAIARDLFTEREHITAKELLEYFSKNDSTEGDNEPNKPPESTGIM